jgi:hypothetical protein
MIKTLALGLLLYTPSHRAPLYAHSNTLPFQAEVFVYSCRQKVQFLAIYEDSRETIPMANPLVTNSDGSYTYFVRSRCLNEVITVNGKVIGWIQSYAGGWEK